MAEDTKVCTLVPVSSFSEALASAGNDGVWIQYSPFGKWSHPVYGETVMDLTKAQKMVKNFNDNVRGQDILLDYEHGLDKNKGRRASGKVLDMEIRNDGIYQKVEFTETARKEIADKEWRYFSPQFHEVWTNPMTGTEHEAVVSGGGLTNQPWIKGMVPLNFSEVVLDMPFTHFKHEDDSWHVLADGDEWKPITNDEFTSLTTSEVAELEHSEPGSGTPPVPRTDGDDVSGDKDGSGSRRDTPAIEREGRMDTSLTNESIAALGLDENADVDTVNGAIVKMFSEVDAIRKAAKELEGIKSFSEQYPEQYAEIERLRAESIASNAKTFSETYAQFSKEDGTTTGKGFSSLALDKIAAASKSFSEGNLEEASKSFTEILDSIASGDAIVDYQGRASGRTKDIQSYDKTDVAKVFSEAAKAAQTEAGGPDKLSWGDAVAAAAQSNPEMYRDFLDSRTHKA